MRTLRIAVVDDSFSDIKTVTSLVREWSEISGRETEIKEYHSAEEFMSDVPGCDILLIDIEMPGMDGVSLARRLRENDKRLVVIFTTYHDEMWNEGFEISALHFLVKPVERAKLFPVLKRAAELSDSPLLEVFAVFETEIGIARIPVDSIVYIEAQRHNIRLVSLSGEYTAKESISSAEERLPKGFFRIHRGYIVNTAHILKMTRNSVSLTGDALLPLSRGKYDSLAMTLIGGSDA